LEQFNKHNNFPSAKATFCLVEANFVLSSETLVSVDAVIQTPHQNLFIIPTFAFAVSISFKNPS